MTAQAILPAGVQGDDTTPRRVSEEEYLAKYAHDFYEWENGELVKVSPVRKFHHDLAAYLFYFFRLYFRLRPIGVVMQAPFLMRVDDFDLKREPDLQIILNDNPGEISETGMIGAADICIEIVLPESTERDFVKKRDEYEQAGVKEYWLFDYLHEGGHFYRLNEQGVYILQAAGSDSMYQTPLLPGFKLHVPTLWVEPLPDEFATVDAVRAMLAGE
jgi:Uma2 family endonuclease